MQVIRLMQRVLLVATLAAMTGCANFYVDTATKEVSASQYKRVEPIHPVQVLFEFQTKGTANASVTSALKASVIEQVKTSGLFSDVSEGTVSSGALLGITVNNVPLTDDAFSKGFATGLTFGLAGSQVSDGYVCSARYTAGAGSEAVVKQARHAIHTTLGASSAPSNGIKMASADEAAKTMLRQIVSNVLNDVSHDPLFK